MSARIPKPTHPSRTRIAAASMIGTTIEFYDFYVYATAAVFVFPVLFFPKGNSTTALLASLATFGLAFAARPLGSALFGHFGDRRGRRSTLIVSLVMMGTATFAIGTLPTYHHVGLLAPALLALLRFTQGLALGGEWSGAALLAAETATPGRRGWAAMWPQLGAPLGFLIANGVFAVLLFVMGGKLTHDDTTGQFYTWGWRLPFLLSAALVAFGLCVRSRLPETPVFARAVARGERVTSPLGDLLCGHWRETLTGTFAVASTFTLFYLVTTWMLSYGTTSRPPRGQGLGYDYPQFLQLQLGAVLLFAIAIPIAGWSIDRFGRRRILLMTSVATFMYGTAFGALLTAGHVTRSSTFTFLAIGMFLTGLAYGPLGAVLPELFPTRVRYSGSGVAFNLAGILGAAVAPFIATWLSTHYGVAYVGIYLSVMAATALLAQSLLPETKMALLEPKVARVRANTP